MTFYIVMFFLAMGALLSTAVASRLWAGLSIIFFAVNLLIGTCVLEAVGRPLTLTDFQMIYEAAHNKGDLWSAEAQFSSSLAKATLVTALLIVCLVYARRLTRRRTNLPLFICTAGVVLSYGFRLVERGDPSALRVPTNFTPTIATSALTFYKVAQQVVHRQGKEFMLKSIPRAPAVRHIVLVIDESIEGEVFSSALKDVRLNNVDDLGIAYSYANCSSASNLMLRWGVNPMDVDQSFRQLPSLFQLAKQNGYLTTYFDAQDALRDRFLYDPEERSFIDEIPPIEDFGVPYDRDLNAVSMLRRSIQKGDRTFAILNKRGTHFPYSNNLPPWQSGVADPYLTSVKRSSIGFLTRLATDLPPGTLVFYTSDHGQNFHSNVPHCNFPPESSPSEWIVPLLVMYSDDVQFIVDRIDERWKNHGSHAALAETLRNLLGYESPWGGSLLASPRENIRFHRGYYGPPRPLIGQCPFLIIDENQRAFKSSQMLQKLGPHSDRSQPSC